jgi:cardiolipin synthase
VRVQETEVQTDRVWTIPNILTFLRLLGIPLFLWLVLVPESDVWAAFVLVVSGVTDYLDGVVARATGQISRLGQLLDPIVDRMFTLATLVGLLLRGIVPVWLVIVLVSRDVVLAVVMALLKRRGITGLPVHFLGKAATFNLLFAFPLLLLGAGTTWAADLCRALGWAFAIWGTALYWWAGILYLVQARRILRVVPVSG